jgi:gamma-glutamyltranspeptidase/glutathione hydrolase
MRIFYLFLICVVTGCGQSEATRSHGAVATAHPLATEAALQAIRNGGNAVDAAVAAAFTLGVVDGHNSGIGGGCFALLRRADGAVLAIDGRETAPGRATRDMYLKNGTPQPDLSRSGALAVATPSALAGYARLLKEGGRLSLAEVILPAAELAEKGFPINAHFAQRLARHAATLATDQACANVLFHPDGTTLKEGDTLRQPDLAATYRHIAAEGTDWFYRGPFAKRLETWMAENGGIIEASDLSDYQTIIREPIRTTYRDFEVLGYPPPSSGGVHVAQILNTLEGFDLASQSGIHLRAEAMKFAFADRAFWLGDPAFVNIPMGLIDKEYGRRIAKKMDPLKANTLAGAGVPPRANADHFPKHTTHIAVADDEGNWVAMTTTVNTSFGAKVMLPGTGVILNNEMDDFSVAPLQPNAFRLVGGEANQIAPGKRPLSSMSPTIVLRNGEPFLTVGAAGGPMIISQVLNVLVSVLDQGMSLKEAIAAPRFHHQWVPDRLMVEETFPQKERAQLEAKGHEVKVLSYMGITNGVHFDGSFIGESEPRIQGAAATW